MSTETNPQTAVTAEAAAPSGLRGHAARIAPHTPHLPLDPESAARYGNPVLSVRDLKVRFPSEAGVVHAVNGMDFDLYPGRSLGIVGESGSGKSVTSLAIMGLLPEYASVEGSARLGDAELIGLTDKEMSRHRGADIGMIFQDPLSALTPVFSIGYQLREALQAHDRKLSDRAANERARELLELVGIPNPERGLKSYPHEFSGGMRQRVVIAIAIANNPRVIIADEPTTALDVTIQAQILEIIAKAQEETGSALIMITHDMGVVAGVADDVIVMKNGDPVERGTVEDIFYHPQNPYTIKLLSAVPRIDRKSNQPLVTSEEEAVEYRRRLEAGEFDEETEATGPKDFSQEPVVLEVNHLTKKFPILKGAFMKRRIGWVHAVNDISFNLHRGETIAIVGESGSGKSTTLLEIMDMGAGKDLEGEIIIAGKDVTKLSRRERRKLRSHIQMVFQDPMGALDPRLTVKDIIAEPLQSLGWEGDIDKRVSDLMHLVELQPEMIDRFPAAFSGGQRQRIAIARALATEPEILVLDEPVSALDVTIQAGVLNLLEKLKVELGVSYVFVSHDLAVVHHIADKVAVMYLGEFVETGPTEQVFANPQHPYTQSLLSAVPIPDPKIERHRKRIHFESDTTNVVYDEGKEPSAYLEAKAKANK
ncbi:ABC transporter ATP-binding protein [Actinobaculum suis]|uniref:ABC transporter ATP-binding protein n=1 Tax=Actinobaculum suis TaxID=1657 RepID=UPI000AC54365|nr:ABC transporter ATP-binding protein [Actinobaculum suis]